MSKAAEMARVSSKGGFHLFWGLIASTLISAVGTIFVARLLGADNYGLYLIALTAPNLISTFRDWGINTAMIKYSAEYNGVGDVAKIKSIFVSGLIFEVVLGLTLSLLSFLLSPFLAMTLNRPIIAPLIQIASFLILTGALVSTATAAFIGMETMHLNSVMLVIHSTVKTFLMVGLLVLGLGTIGAATGFTISTLFAGLTGILLTWTMYKALPKPVKNKLEFLSTTKTMLKYGLPLSIGTIITGFLTQFYAYILAIYVSNNATIGNYHVALDFVILITFFVTPVTTMLFPAFSKLDYKKDQKTLKSVFRYSVKYASLIVVPITAMVIVLAQPAISTIFQDKYAQAPLFLALSSVSNLFTAFGNLSIGNLINGQGYTKYNMKLTLLTAVIGFPLSFVLIFYFGVIGLIVTTSIVVLPSLFLGLRFAMKHFGVSVPWISSAKILFSSAIAATFAYLLIFQLVFISPIRLLIGIIIFTIIFILATILTRTVNETDVNNFREIVNGLGLLRKPINTLLNFFEKLMRILNR